MAIVSMEHVLYVIFTAISFSTFLKFLSGRLYLFQHRMLPTIAGIITVFNFYIIIIPFMNSPQTVELLMLLADMCSMVIMFMMFFYMLELRQPKHHEIIRIVVLIIMVGLCLGEFLAFRFGWPQPQLDFMAGVAVFIASAIVSCFSKPSFRIESDDKAIVQVMRFTFIISIVAYVIQSVFMPDNYMVTAIAYAIDCVLYFDIANNNRIEDTRAILKGSIYDMMEEPVFLFGKRFQLLDLNQVAVDRISNRQDLGFAFEDGDYNKKCTLIEKMVQNGEQYRDMYVGDEWFKLHVASVKVKDDVRGYIVSAADVTDKYRQIAEARSETREKSQFLAQMSHELRSPLHAIIGLSDILLTKHDISTKNRGSVRHIKNASERLLNLVDAILDYSKLESGKFSFIEKRYSVEKLLNEITYDNVVNLGNKDVDLAIVVKTEYPHHLYGDDIRVREVLQNLIGNAIKFTDRGSVMAELGFYPEEERCKVTFAVKDTGRGMTPDQIKGVFSEYISTADGVMIEGTGLGLTITRQIVELLDGYIKAESDGVSGTTMYGEFYQTRSGSEFKPKKIFNKRAVMQQDINFAPDIALDWIYPQAKILVADDMKINQEIFSQLLLPWHCKVDMVSDGLEAVEMAKTNDYQLIFLDHMMVHCSGIEAAEQIRKFNKEVPIILVTANTAEGLRSSLAEHGITDYMGKPVRAQELKAILDTNITLAYREKDYRRSSARTHRRDALVAYRRTLEVFVKEMGPLLLQLPKYKSENKDLFRIKVHGVKGVSREIGRETFADQAEIMEMAAKAEHWDFVDKHFEEFTTALCDTIEDVTEELGQLAPDLDPTLSILDDVAPEDITLDKIQQVLEELLRAFDAYDITKIENGIKALEIVDLDKRESKVYSKLLDAYDNLEYEDGSKALREYFDDDKSAI